MATTKGQGYCMLPWGKYLRKRGMRDLSNAEIAVLPVIAAHADKKTREAKPGYKRICALARVGKETVKEAVDALVDNRWIATFPILEGPRSRNGYRLLFGYDKNNKDDNYTREWIALHHELIFSGVWGAMTGAIRRVYLILRAFAWEGRNAVPDGYLSLPDELDPILICDRETKECQEFDHADVQFLPEHIYAPAEFARLSGVAPRTFRDAMAWLTDNRLIIPYRDGSIAGFIIPFRPGLHAPDVIEAVRKAKEESAPNASPEAKHSFGAMHRRSRQKKITPPAGKKLERL